MGGSTVKDTWEGFMRDVREAHISNEAPGSLNYIPLLSSYVMITASC
jgi:hypothetical protein